MPSNAQARIAINKLPQDAGWRFLPDKQELLDCIASSVPLDEFARVA